MTSQSTGTTDKSVTNFCPENLGQFFFFGKHPPFFVVAPYDEQPCVFNMTLFDWARLLCFEIGYLLTFLNLFTRLSLEESPWARPRPQKLLTLVVWQKCQIIIFLVLRSKHFPTFGEAVGWGARLRQASVLFTRKHFFYMFYRLVCIDIMKKG